MAKATLVSIPPIIGAYIDETGELPTTWDDLSSIAVVMTSSGPATGSLKLQSNFQEPIYELTIEGPTKSTILINSKLFHQNTHR